MCEKNFFHGCQIFILPNGILKKRKKLFEDKISLYGGSLITQPQITPPTHIVLEDNILLNPLRVVSTLKSANLPTEKLTAEIVGTFWLSKCLQEKKLLGTENFKFKRKSSVSAGQDQDSCSPPKIPKTEVPHEILPKTAQLQSNSSETGNQSKNELIIEEFQKLADSYRARRDTWRTLGYEKAISAIKSCKKEITDVRDLSHIPQISGKMAEKVVEILENGYLDKARELFEDEKTKILDMFGKVWGAGNLTAQMWYQQGFRTFEDLEKKANLTAQQKIGLKYYYDIQERIPRQEVEEINKIIKDVALEIDPSLCVMPCGSYRRGKQECGDIDVLLIRKDTDKTENVLFKIISKLKSMSFLIDHLVDTENNETPRKYLGICRLPKENSKNRRLDIFLVRESESATAIMHYTGSALFNRAIRLHASRNNMHLSEHGLYRAVHQDMEVMKKHVIPTPDEETIFRHLNLPYRGPEDREMF